MWAAHRATGIWIRSMVISVEPCAPDKCNDYGDQIIVIGAAQAERRNSWEISTGVLFKPWEDEEWEWPGNGLRMALF